ncbi:tyrosine-protein kinase srms-like [Sesbania bispinosa]|nr:tyrosine-protein kinase srms-like [Sesbania bispinosa]
MMVVCCYGVTNGGSQRSLRVFYGGRWKILRSYLDAPCYALWWSLTLPDIVDGENRGGVGWGIRRRTTEGWLGVGRVVSVLKKKKEP